MVGICCLVLVSYCVDILARCACSGLRPQACTVATWATAGIASSTCNFVNGPADSSSRFRTAPLKKYCTGEYQYHVVHRNSRPCWPETVA